MTQYFSITASIKNDPDDTEALDILDSFISVIEDAGLGCCGVTKFGRMEYWVTENPDTMKKWVVPGIAGKVLEDGREVLRKYMEHCGDFENIEIGGIVEQ